jgi:septal ring-binding cell division protein DamX
LDVREIQIKGLLLQGLFTVVLLSGCAPIEKLKVDEKAIVDRQGSIVVSGKARESASVCYGDSVDKESWRCRILDENSYVIAVQENQPDANKLGTWPLSQASTAGKVNKYGYSLVRNFLQLADQFYVVQIFANSNKSAGVDFINTKRLGRARLLHTRVNGRDWYVALLGVYPDLELANKRAKAYQEVHRGVTPWVRSVKSLKLVYKGTII